MLDNPDNPDTCMQKYQTSWGLGRKVWYLCIIVCMSKYVYQIQGALQSPMGKFLGLRCLVCNVDFLDMVDVPVEILDNNTTKYIQFRLSITAEALDIQRLPVEIQNRIRVPLGRWLDRWVLENFYGNTQHGKSINP
jgi:hypothetical protein